MDVYRSYRSYIDSLANVRVWVDYSMHNHNHNPNPPKGGAESGMWLRSQVVRIYSEVRVVAMHVSI